MHSQLNLVLFLASVAVFAPPATAAAEVARHAILIGNNTGARDEGDLKFAENDARKLAEVLKTLGDVPPENVTIMTGASAEQVRRALITINDRIRNGPSQGGQTVLFVYYSGHADARALHLGGTELPLAELEQLVRGSAAGFRLLILDACRSGSLTKVKGAEPGPAFVNKLDSRLVGQGAVFLTSSSATEDAQESDELRGSFFTHHLVSGLLGAADGNGDGQVTLTEAYRHAYEATVRASSRTQIGLQHPTFRYDLAGHGDLVLARPGREPGKRARLLLPDGLTFVIFRNDESGEVVAEVSERDSNRALSLAPGRYHLRGRARAFLLEGAVELTPGRTAVVRTDELDRVAYARLVRKGGHELDRARSLDAGLRGRGTIHGGGAVSLGVAAQYRVDLPRASLAARLVGTRGGFENDALAAANHEVALELRLGHAWDRASFTIDVGFFIGGAWLFQRFDAPPGARAPARSALAGIFGVSGLLAAELGRRTFATFELGAATYLVPMGTGGATKALEARFAPVVTAGAGLRF